MKVSELFRVALKEVLKIHGCTQKKMSDDLGINTILVNNFLKSRKNFSEDRMEVIAEYFNMSLFEMLNLGHQLAVQDGLIMDDQVTVEVVRRIKPSDIAKKAESLNQEDLEIINTMIDRLIKE